ncbi:hypothetical protein HC864_02975 [Candidatus Gracilibacteria bacterium]|nr:hypothetical protein [Candidatus Gracilibacteria bacterium]
MSLNRLDMRNKIERSSMDEIREMIRKGEIKKHLRILPDDPDAFEKKKYFLARTREEFFQKYPDHKEY